MQVQGVDLDALEVNLERSAMAPTKSFESQGLKHTIMQRDKRVTISHERKQHRSLLAEPDHSHNKYRLATRMVNN